MRRAPLLALVACLLAVTSVEAAESPGVEIHGYGGWAYGRNDADGVGYLASSSRGEADYLNLAVALASRASDRVFINAQVWWESRPGDEEVATVDYAFGEWRFSDALRLRMGQVKHPFGIYTEIFDVGTIRPFFWLPQGIYGPTGTVAESYRGLGLTGSRFNAGGWEFEYDVYAGQMRLESTDPALMALVGGGGEPEGSAAEGAPLRDLVGGRLTLNSPGCGARAGVSAYSGHMDEAGESWRHTAFGAHVEYLTSAWSMRAEYTHLDEENRLASDAFYVEAARRVLGPLEIAARFDRTAERLEGVATDAAPDLLRHREVSVGLNYWFHPDLVAKLAVSRVRGNRFAYPEDLADAIADEALPERTGFLSLGVQFAF